MKAAVVTFIRAYNYGAVLQCYALCKSLQKLGVDVETLDYCPRYFKDLYSLSHLGKPRYLPYRPIKNWLKYTPIFYKITKRNKGFDRFIRKNIPLSDKQYQTKEELNNENFKYDIFISGSDQVWHYRWTKFDEVFFLQFADLRNDQKVSYAASFGFSEIPDDLRDEYRNRLKDWSAYSVREKSGQSILSELLDVQSEVCCDPTLLLTAEEWSEVEDKKRINKPYILIYTVGNEPRLFEYADKLSKETGIKVVFLPCVMEDRYFSGEIVNQYGFKTVAHAAPDEWLNYFENASYVVTESFHGTVFSLIKHKPFLVCIERTDGTTNNRASELLATCGVTDRDLDASFTKSIYADIDWENVDRQLEKLRKTSMKYLESIKDIHYER